MQRVVVKVGSAVLTQEDEIALERMQSLVDFLVHIKQASTCCHRSACSHEKVRQKISNA